MFNYFNRKRQDAVFSSLVALKIANERFSLKKSGELSLFRSLYYSLVIRDILFSPIKAILFRYRQEKYIRLIQSDASSTELDLSAQNLLSSFSDLKFGEKIENKALNLIFQCLIEGRVKESEIKAGLKDLDFYVNKQGQLIFRQTSKLVRLFGQALFMTSFLFAILLIGFIFLYLVRMGCICDCAILGAIHLTAISTIFSWAGCRIGFRKYNDDLSSLLFSVQILLPKPS